MKDKITRRQLIKNTMSAGSAMVIFPVFQLDDPLSPSCNNCGFNRKGLTSSAHFHLLKKQYCPNCGIKRFSLTYPVCAQCDQNTAATRRIEIQKKQRYPVCCQVPFPDKALAGKTNKPVFCITDLRF